MGYRCQVNSSKVESLGSMASELGSSGVCGLCRVCWISFCVTGRDLLVASISISTERGGGNSMLGLFEIV